jgi:hypothetical protein
MVVFCVALSATQVGSYRQFKEVIPKESGREKQNFNVLDLAGGFIETSDDSVCEFFGLLLRRWRTFVDIKDVPLPVVLERQFFFHFVSPFTNFRVA